jgi:hypothetical protein
MQKNLLYQNDLAFYQIKGQVFPKCKNKTVLPNDLAFYQVKGQTLVRDIDGMAGEGVEERGQNHRGLKPKK